MNNGDGLDIGHAFNICKIQCPVCGNQIAMVPKDEEYQWCSQCQAIRTRFGYTPSLYDRSYAETYLNYAQSPINTSLNLFRLGLVASFIPKSSCILDVGCSVGEFLRFAERYYKCHGFEPNAEAAHHAQIRTLDSLIFTSLNGSKKYDAITMFDVIEHLDDPINFIRHCESILNPGGIIALTTPTSDCLYGRTDSYVRHWKHWKPKEHLFIHSRKSLEIMFNRFQMEVVRWGEEESLIRPGNENKDLLTCVAKKSSN